MELVIRSIELSSFKGYKNATFNLTENTTITGANGKGKTTIATAHSWLWFNKDYQTGKDNPDLFPLGVEEAEPRVIENIEIDGKPIKVEKFQKKKVSKPDVNGIVKVSVTNSYTINDVPKTERDFKKYFEDLGYDFKLALLLSHPDLFFTQKADEMRSVLCSMVGTYTEKEIAEKTEGADDLVELLNNYTIEEIKATQISKKRIINENYGKDGEIIRAKIEAKETAKIDVDVTKVNEEIKELNAQLDEVNYSIADIDLQNSTIGEKKTSIRDLINSFTYERTKLYREISKPSNEITELDLTIRNLDYTLSNLNRELQILDANIERSQKYVESLQSDYKAERAKKFSSKSDKCYTCGQLLPKETVLAMMKKFESEKEERLEYIKKSGTEMCAKRDKDIASRNELKAKITETETLLALNRGKMNALVKNDNKEDRYSEIELLDKKIGELNEEFDALKTIDNSSALAKKESLIREITEKEKQLTANIYNEALDVQIAELVSEQRKYEQEKANSEKILYQIDLFEKAKNELLVKDINNHFKLVDFKLWETYKNGEYKPICRATYKGKEYNIATNTGLELLMKLDVIDGLQKFYDQKYPVFIDGAECLSSDTEKLTTLESQKIWLKVGEGELKVN